MARSRRGAFLALVLTLAPALPSACGAGELPDTLTFRSLPGSLVPATPPSYLERHREPLLLASATLMAGCLISSQFLLRSADKRYDLYQVASDPQLLESYYLQSRTRDRWSNALLFTGECAGAALLLLVAHGSGPGPSLALHAAPWQGGVAMSVAWGGR